ncbi:NADP-dependent glyceraldehyde-3-phosphate dehydrogenase [Streptobacillus moniliformis]|uniref:Aldehyde Dehydrogenase n=1 Tax=Streptobacillus moniliformis (strain ATCC 14647 / DSM 12112 / NCTC 10651 / 9901) TaxID=519441 RepID=D1AY93_STRM9|nr:NADP-dependent glyceraldehyde-3-phosphate dehydrogenase [Streptobacillus moniliformis]ACZ01269.1 Aldehyde Dehydrogenase [Streptobacillus moniliformis DSM 12112]AVL42374.1 NADP-dependent glyceraldehyde-3-phosphate dehydrogenase [Streptobacillus moniliformis]SQA13574.1 NADP-dependent glyceraldehyde-3-phosphate dehydrogenase [Streptobacillus moniliformis]
MKINVLSPIDGSVLGSVKKMTQEDVNQIYINSRKSFKEWKKLSTAKRAEIMYKAADILDENKERIAILMSKEISKPFKDSLAEIERTVGLIKYSAEEGMRIFGEVYEGKNYDESSKNKVAIVRREPVGIVLAISPFNYPINLAASKIIPALISGNTVVFKPASQGVLSGIELVKCFEEAGLPEGVLQIITGKGSEIGDYLNTHKEIDFINFTGSTSVGEKIGIQAKMKPILLELGGKDAAIVLEDANLDKAANDIVSGAFSYSGQRCTAIKRVLVMENVADELVDKIKNKVLNLKVGNPFENVVITPLIDEKSAIFVENLIMDAINKGAKALTEIKRESNLIYPVLLDNVNTEMDIAWEEPFGPVLPIIRVKSEKEALEIANNSEYGLQSSIFTNNIEKAFKFANELEVGTVHINNKTQRGPDNFPFLGIKNSGSGVQGIRHSILSMTKIKTIVLDM